MSKYKLFHPLAQEEDISSFRLLGAGSGHIVPGAAYGPGPEGWVRDIYAFVYISGGVGFFQHAGLPRQVIGAGDVFYIFPEEWHTYGPHPALGWVEHWVMFHGPCAEGWRREGLLPDNPPLLHIGRDERVIQLCEELIAFPEDEGGLHLCALFQGFTHHLAAWIRYRAGERERSERPYAALIRSACRHLAEHLGQGVVMEELASGLGMGYHHFRRVFRRQTGLSPQRYLLELRIQRAKVLLSRPGAAVKTVAAAVGFSDPYYFSRQFSQLAGVAPSAWWVR